MNTEIHIEAELPATPAQVMHMLTDAAQIAIWSGEPAVFEAKTGGAVRLFDGWMTGVVKQISASALSYSWKTADWPEETMESLVTLSLKEKDGQTLLLLHHSGLPGGEEAASHKAGWYDFFLTPLEDYLMVRYNA